MHAHLVCNLCFNPFMKHGMLLEVQIQLYCIAYAVLLSRFEIFRSGVPLYMVFYGVSFQLMLFEQLNLWRCYLIFLWKPLWWLSRILLPLSNSQIWDLNYRVSQKCFKLLMLPPCSKIISTCSHSGIIIRITCYNF